MAKKKRVSKKRKNQQQEMLVILYAIVVIVLALIGLFQSGIVGKWFVIVMQFLTGKHYYIILYLMILVGLYMIFRRHLPEPDSKMYVGFSFLVMAMLLLNAVPQDQTTGAVAFKSFWENSKLLVHEKPANVAGGFVGACMYFVTSSLVDVTGTYFIVGGLFVVAFLLLINKKHIDDFKEFATLPMHMPPVERTKQSHSSKRNETKTTKEKKSLKDCFVESVEEDEYENDIYDTSDVDFITLGKKKQGVFLDVKQNDIEEVEEKDDCFNHDNISLMEYSVNEHDVDDAQIVSMTETMVSTSEVEHPKDDLSQKESNHYNDYVKYQLPNPSRLLELHKKDVSDVNVTVARAKAIELKKVLRSFNIQATLNESEDICIGPAVTRFVIHPESGVKVNRIQNIQDNIKMSLAAKDIRIQAPIPGMNGVGVEIPNERITPVYMSDLFRKIPEDKRNKKLLVALGKDLMGNLVYGELDRLPHLLVAGATGSGKSVCINSMICSLLLRTSPRELKLLLIDPKQVEFPQYKNVPHLLGPVITDPSKAAFALSVIVARMDERYKEFARVQVRKIDDYNEYVKNHPEDVQAKFMPYIVVFIDELADLMAVAGKEVEGHIQRITQLARAAGIHLVVATQRPSVNVITGVIKSNIPSRIAFAVSSQIDSRTILDHAGAEHLLGKGDMLYVPMGEPEPIRVQGVYVTDAEVERITAYVSDQAKPCFDDAFVLVDGPIDNSGVRNAPQDPMYEEVRNWVIQQQKASTSLLQRAFGFGYNRAARIVDMLQQDGVIGPAQGSKPREVLIKPDQGGDFI